MKASSPSERSRYSNMITILLVDDDLLYRRAIKRAILSWGWRVKEAGDGVEAIELIKETDLVLSDIDMPNMNGIELSIKIKSSNPNFPVLLMSGGYTDIGDIRDFLPKPSKIELIKFKIEEMINSRRK